MAERFGQWRMGGGGRSIATDDPRVRAARKNRFCSLDWAVCERISLNGTGSSHDRARSWLDPVPLREIRSQTAQSNEQNRFFRAARTRGSSVAIDRPPPPIRHCPKRSAIPGWLPAKAEG